MTTLPKYKVVHPFYHSKPGILRLGDMVDFSFEIEDADGCIKQLVSYLDGNHTIEEIYERLMRDFPSLTIEDVSDAVESIDELGFLYDESEEKSIALTADERKRYKGNLNYFSFFSNLAVPPSHFQQKLNEANVTILGMGAFGCSILFNLAGLGVKKVRIVDFDHVELSNLNRQMLFNEQDLGKLKVDAAKNFMNSFFSEMEIEAINKEISSQEDVEELISGSDVVVVCADQPPAAIQRWINKACVEMNIPFFGGGINLTMGSLFGVIPGETACLDCDLYQHGQMSNDIPSIVERFFETNFIPPNNAIAPNLMIITGMVAAEVMNYITGMDKLISPGKSIRFDFRTMEKKVLREIPRYEENCPTCGKGVGSSPIFEAFNNSDFIRKPVKR
ncbi:ThiF family adenylyltransferase [Falsibacillus pallidus]|uniref:ThiF family adenylyltransferase n=1 Tax=Falsibacillus pallidus TaxID=493781 RepID=UPI003D99E6C2